MRPRMRHVGDLPYPKRGMIFMCHDGNTIHTGMGYSMEEAYKNYLKYKQIAERNNYWRDIFV